jgi:hypothetical protein
MKVIRLICLAAMAALLLVPGLARAAPERITVTAYRERLQSAVVHLYARRIDDARSALGETWLVEATPEPILVDLRPVQAALGKEGDINLVLAHIEALDALEAAESRSLPGARQNLEKALGDAEEASNATNTLSDWLDQVFRRLFGDGPSAPAPGRGSSASPSLTTWAALAVGVAGIAALGWFLLRSLAGNAAGEQVSLRPGRRAVRPDRPLTPDELWALAREEAAVGDYKEGLRLAHLALLQHLDRAGLLRYMPAQTNREHEWSLRRKHPALARTMHQLNDLVESRLYSGHGASAEDFQRGEAIARELWREGEAVSKSAQATSGASSSASSS